MRLTDESSSCVVSFVSGPSTSNSSSSGTTLSQERGRGEETGSRLSCPPITYWLNRFINHGQNSTKKKKTPNRYSSKRKEGGGRGRGGGRDCSSRLKGMLLRYVFDFIRGFLFLVKQIFLLSRKKIIEYQSVRYPICPLSPILETRLFSVKRKIMVLDLDETLIHSHHDNSTVVPAVEMVPDFYVRVYIDSHPVKFYVYKRPHVDYFLSVICQWYDLVVFTASMQKYGMEVANHLDQNKGILPRRYFRQDCTVDMNGYTKNLSMISEDLGNIFILDNSPSAYRSNPDNAIPITSWFSDPLDTGLLDLLPFLDSLRFTNDVRSVLSRNLHQHSLW